MHSVTAQYSYHTVDQNEPLGEMDLAKALETFDEFDWLGEAERADQLKQCSPTLAFEDETKDRLLWVSSYVPDGKLHFVSQCKLPGKVSKLFGLRNRQGIVDLSTGDFEAQQARRAIELFYAYDSKGLRELFLP